MAADAKDEGASGYAGVSSSRIGLVAAGIFASCCCLALTLFGLHHLYVQVPGAVNKCQMTYMQPNYYPVPMANHSRIAFRYRLFRYSHEHMSEAEALDGLRSGRVVMFLPGSTGSFGQVRSLGKELIVRAGRGGVAIFGLDFAEEVSALSGGLLERQVEFARDALRRIVELHAASFSSTDADISQLRVALFGHSMGGIVARSLLAQVDSNDVGEAALAEPVVALITLSSPHTAPVFGADIVMHQIYNAIRAHKDKRRLYLSLAGGYRDTLVSGTLSPLDKSRYRLSASALTVSVAEGVSTDHLDILWCNQVIVQLAEELMVVFAADSSALAKATSSLALFKKMSKQTIPRIGFARKIAEAFFPRDETWPQQDLLAFAINTVTRQQGLWIFQLMFAAATLVLVSGQMNAAHATGLVVAWTAAWLAVVSDTQLVWVPIVLLGDACVIVTVFVFLSSLVLSGLNRILPLVQLLSFVTTAWWLKSSYKSAPWGSHYVAAVYLMVMFNTALAVVTAVTSAGLGGIFVVLGSPRSTWTPKHWELAMGVMYLPTLAAWVGPTVQALAILQAPLPFEDVYPLAYPHNEQRGTYHPVPRASVPPIFFDENGTLVPPTGDLKESTLLFFDNNGFQAMSSDEGLFLLVSLLCALPVLIHLSNMHYYPIHASEEKVLDSHYQRVRPKSKPETSTTVKPVASSLRQHKKKGDTDEQKQCVEASTTTKGALVFRDTAYAPDSEPMIMVFANGEEIQLDELESLDPAVDYLPDALPLIGDGLDKRDGTSVVLVQRIRSGIKSFPDSTLLRSLLITLAFVCSLPGKEYLFLMQYSAALSATACIIFRARTKPVERYVHKKMVG